MSNLTIRRSIALWGFTREMNPICSPSQSFFPSRDSTPCHLRPVSIQSCCYHPAAMLTDPCWMSVVHQLGEGHRDTVFIYHRHTALGHIGIYCYCFHLSLSLKGRRLSASCSCSRLFTRHSARMGESLPQKSRLSFLNADNADIRLRSCLCHCSSWSVLRLGAHGFAVPASAPLALLIGGESTSAANGPLSLKFLHGSQRDSLFFQNIF